MKGEREGRRAPSPIEISGDGTGRRPWLSYAVKWTWTRSINSCMQGRPSCHRSDAYSS